MFQKSPGNGIESATTDSTVFQLFGETCRSLHATGSHLPTSATTDERMQSISITALKECHQAGLSCHWKSAICNQFERLPCNVSGHIFVLVQSTKLKLDTCIYMWVCMYLNSMIVWACAFNPICIISAGAEILGAERIPRSLTGREQRAHDAQSTLEEWILDGFNTGWIWNNTADKVSAALEECLLCFAGFYVWAGLHVHDTQDLVDTVTLSIFGQWVFFVCVSVCSILCSRYCCGPCLATGLNQILDVACSL